MRPAAALLLFLLLPWPALADSKAALRILAVEEPPLSFSTRDRQAQGYAVDVLEELQRRTGNRDRVEIEPESRVYATGLRAPNVVMLSFSRTPLREASFHWLLRIARKPWVFYGRGDDPRRLASLAEARRLGSVGVVSGDVRAQWLQAEQFGNLVMAGGHEQGIRLLVAGRIDVLLDEPQAIAWYCRAQRCGTQPPRPLWAPRVSDVYIMMSKRGTDPALARAWRAAADAMVADGTLERMARRWAQEAARDFGVRSTVRNGVLDFCVGVQGC